MNLTPDDLLYPQGEMKLPPVETDKYFDCLGWSGEFSILSQRIMKLTGIGVTIPRRETKNSREEIISTGGGMIFSRGGIRVLLCEIVPIEWEMELLCFEILPCQIIADALRSSRHSCRRFGQHKSDMESIIGEGGGTSGVVVIKC